MRLRLTLFVLLVAVTLAAPAAAQTVLNPTKAEFIASADHDAMFGGVALRIGVGEARKDAAR